MKTQPLQRILGTPTALLLGIGVAIGSGIFRTPGEVAASIHQPWLILLAWVLGGVIVLMQGLVTAELATRFPQAGGEYVFLREAYGEFVAFFFGWSYTFFVIGGGVATMARAFGDFACELLALGEAYSGPLAAGAILIVMIINAMGLRAGAAAQNAMTVAKILALLAVVGIGFVHAASGTGYHSPVAQSGGAGWPGGGAFLAALLAILWSYDGTTDAVKMAEEVKDVRHGLPRALIGSAVVLMLLYVGFNGALMRIMPPADMAQVASVPGEAMSRLFGPIGKNTMLLVAMVVCLGSLSSTVLATIRVTFALARDGLAFPFMARMSTSQAPIPALIVVAGFAVVLVLNRKFSEVLGIYFFASAFLFALSYASLIIFRVRDHTFPSHVYHCPFGAVLAVILIVIQLVIAVNIAWGSPRDALYTALLLGAFGLLYFVWRHRVPEVD